MGGPYLQGCKSTGTTANIRAYSLNLALNKRQNNHKPAHTCLRDQNSVSNKANGKLRRLN
jgi:hypothetical protein